VNTTLPKPPAALAVNADLIPATLKPLKRWVTWAYTPEQDPETGETDWDKPPRNARTGGPASSTNPKTWSTYDKVLDAYRRGGLDGLGFVLDGSDDHVAVDLDRCRDPQTGALDPWAQEIVRSLKTYTEVSPSGRGLRLILRGKLPSHGRKKGAYENYSGGRYVTVTGAHLAGTPRTIEGRGPELLAVHRKVFGEPQPPARERNGHAPAPDLDDAEVVRLASQAKHGSKFRALWGGSAHGFASNSEADLALVNYLAFWCGPDPERIDALFRQSGLFRSKWNRGTTATGPSARPSKKDAGLPESLRQDKQLGDRLAAEREGILAWLVRGASTGRGRG
jgi:primase-polymerase (primpol)-like protein